MTDYPKNESAPASRAPKRLYAKPHVAVYGTLRELTQAVGAMGAPDNASMGPKNTHL
jgi:hypothetical protein